MMKRFWHAAERRDATVLWRPSRAATVLSGAFAAPCLQMWACCHQHKRESLLSILRDLKYRSSKREHVTGGRGAPVAT